MVDDTGMQEDQIVIIRTYLSGHRKAVIDRDTDVLTLAELNEDKPMVQAAILEELKAQVAMTMEL